MFKVYTLLMHILDNVVLGPKLMLCNDILKITKYGTFNMYTLTSLFWKPSFLNIYMC